MVVPKNKTSKSIKQTNQPFCLIIKMIGHDILTRRTVPATREFVVEFVVWCLCSEHLMFSTKSLARYQSCGLPEHCDYETREEILHHYKKLHDILTGAKSNAKSQSLASKEGGNF